MKTDDLTRKAEDVTKAAKDTARAVRDKAGAALGDIGARAADAAGTIREDVSERVEAVKDRLVDEGSRLASSIRDAVDSPDADSLPGRVFDTVATALTDTVESLRGKSLNDIAADVQGFAKKHPGAFVAAAALTGFALARFGRATGRRPSGNGSASDGGSSRDDDFREQFYRHPRERATDDSGRDAGLRRESALMGSREEEQAL